MAADLSAPQGAIQMIILCIDNDHHLGRASNVQEG